MQALLKNGYKAMKRPSGHNISKNFDADNNASIPPNLLAMPNTESNSHYLRYCKEHRLKVHPARYPAELPEYFVRMLTDKNDLVLDPFGGSCVTGEVCERLGRRWICVELVEEYLEGALARFEGEDGRGPGDAQAGADGPRNRTYYRIPRPGLLWNGNTKGRLAGDGGERRGQPNGKRTKKNKKGR
jgi:site-specific DNA-methyltransferase (cytosine-N4-specific)